MMSQQIRDVILLHDNVRSHTAVLTATGWKKIHSTLMEHSPYSPDLWPWDFHLFDNNARRQRDFCTTGYKHIPLLSLMKERNANSIEKCVSKSRDYVDKWYINFVFYFIDSIKFKRKVMVYYWPSLMKYLHFTSTICYHEHLDY